MRIATTHYGMQSVVENLRAHRAQACGCVRWLLVGIVLCSFPSEAAWNDPYPEADADKNFMYQAFVERPKHLDPVSAYSSNEYAILAQIYEPPFQYHYLKRPYVLVPLTATRIPEPTYLDREGRRLPTDAAIERVAYSVYEIQIRPGIHFQPHPAFARKPNGSYRYLDLSAEDLAQVGHLSDFLEQGTRELVAADYIYQIKRLA